MAVNEIERFIRDAAKLGWSRNEVCEVLGLSWSSLVAMLEIIGPLDWVPGSESLARKRCAESQRGIFTPHLQTALQTAIAKRRELAEHEVLGSRGTIKELAAAFGVSASTVRRRVASGFTLEDALTTPATPCHLRRTQTLTDKAEELKR